MIFVYLVPEWYFLCMKHFIFILLFLTCCNLYAQVYQPAGKLDVNTKPGGQVAVIEENEKIIEGSYYLLNGWNKGDIHTFVGNPLEDIELRYNIENQILEGKTDTWTKVFPNNVVDYFKIFDKRTLQFRHFANCSNFKSELIFFGYFEIIADGKMKLLAKYDTKIKNAYYVIALDAGSKNDQIIQVETIFIERDGQVIELPKKKKDTYDLFEELSHKIEAFSKEKKLNPRKKEDLAEIIKYYNSL